MKTTLGAPAAGAAASSALSAGASRRVAAASRRCSLLVANVAVPSRPPTAHPARRSKVEIIKEQSDYLRHPLMEVRAVRGRARATNPLWLLFFCLASTPLTAAAPARTRARLSFRARRS